MSRTKSGGRWPVLAVALAIGCGAATAEMRGPPAEMGPPWNPWVWFHERPCFTPAEVAYIWDRFDAATQIAHDGAGAVAPAPRVERGVAVLERERRAGPRRGVGVVRFEQDDDHLLVSVDASGLPPGEHAFTVYDAASCDDLRRAGHFNPTRSEHGPIGARDRHAGDLGNLLADDQGNASLMLVTGSLSITGDESIVGKTIVVHARRDDGTTQPSGGAGRPIACGVVRLSTRDVAMER